MVFFIADTHFGHKNVLKLYDRPFETIRWFSCFITPESLIWFRLFLVRYSDTGTPVKRGIFHEKRASPQSPAAVEVFRESTSNAITAFKQKEMDYP